MKTNWKTSALILLCTVSLTGCTQTNTKEKAPEQTTETGAVIHIGSEQEFNNAIAQGNVVVDFYSNGCGPCQRMSPVIDDLAKEMLGTIFVKVDTEKFKALSTKFGIRAVPTLIFFKDGQKIRQVSGARSKVELRNEINTTF